MNFTKKMMEHISALSRLKLTDQETIQLTRELETIVSYMDILAQLPTDGVEPMSHSFPVENVLREDKVLPSGDRTAMLANSPETDGETFLVPKAVE